MYSKDSVKTYEFSFIKFSVKNYRGVYFLSDKIKEEIKQLSVSQAKEINKEAWKQKNLHCKIANRHSNWSVSGNINLYEESSSHYNVAEQIAKETYKRMMGY